MDVRYKCTPQSSKAYEEEEVGVQVPKALASVAFPGCFHESPGRVFWTIRRLGSTKGILQTVTMVDLASKIKYHLCHMACAAFSTFFFPL